MVRYTLTSHNTHIYTRRTYKIPAIVLSVLLLRLWFRFFGLCVVVQQFINENDYVSRVALP